MMESSVAQDEGVLLLDRCGDVLIATLNRPHKGNSLSTELIVALGDMAKEITRPEGRYQSVKAIVITGKGDSIFSSGADINNLRGLTEESARQQMLRGQVIFNALEDAKQVIIAAVNGIAFGGGLELAMACDLRIASPSARFGQPEITLGNLPGWGGTQRLPHLIGEGRALELILTGEPVDAERAFTIGLVNTLADDPLSAAIKLANQIAGKSALAVDAAKKAVYAGRRLGITRGLEIEAAMVGKCSISPEQQAAVQAFFDRRQRPIRESGTS